VVIGDRQGSPVIRLEDAALGACGAQGPGAGAPSVLRPAAYRGCVLGRLVLAVLAVLALFAVVALFRIVRDALERRR
jgi:hypothetical protein